MNYMYIYYLFIYLFIYLIIHLLISYLFIFVDDAFTYSLVWLMTLLHTPLPLSISQCGVTLTRSLSMEAEVYKEAIVNACFIDDYIAE